MDRAIRDQEFTEFAVARADRLRRTAYLMCGDWHRAQDLTQIGLAKAYAAWHRIHGDGAVDAYVRQIIVREFLSQQRRRSWHERPSDDLPEQAGDGGQDRAELRLSLLAALARLTPKRRAVIVLRYWEDRSVEETASALRMSRSAVKSASLRGLAELRNLLGEDLPV
ncbi:SigE family RNA polymerase sigma factor [Catenulispora pinistramenti]|uniref:SigE family RNA polymerase sigma factor n=1 Tax=Catenulispora pinistramenti TaxID=2705254 RepID=UPI0027DC1DE7|nr:SigE family RNA polymerase sigma factor [Catenulispora pinistramenti]